MLYTNTLDSGDRKLRWGGASVSMIWAEKALDKISLDSLADFLACFFFPLVVAVYELSISDLFLAISAASLSLNPSKILAILLLRLTSVTSLAYCFCFLPAGAGDSR
jgi:hypothetical protein